jgi:hypothetical protein
VTNLNRGVLFRLRDLDLPKAHIGATAAVRADFQVIPVTNDAAVVATTARLLISAVDKNASRAGLQQLYRPWLLSASTRDLRAEVLRPGPPGVGACLRCFNVPEPEVGDDELRNLALDPEHGGLALAQIAQENNLIVGDARSILSRRACDRISEKALQGLRDIFGYRTADFSVGFTSVFAGVMLAAETIKLLMGQNLGMDPSHNTATFQFFAPSSPTNRSGILARDSSCPACNPADVRTEVWASRRRVWPASSAEMPSSAVIGRDKRDFGSN